MMIRHHVGLAPYYTFEAFRQYPQVLNAVFTRLGGSRPPLWGLNVGHSVGDTPEAVEDNHHLVYQTLGISPSQVVTAHQVHGSHVAPVDLPNCGTVLPETDSLITAQSGITLMLRFADCLPILLYDPSTPAVGLGHAGWRGTAAQIAPHMVKAMSESFGTDPAALVVALGPAVGPCCYEVGPEVAEAIAPTLTDPRQAVLGQTDGRLSLDLWEANRQQLEDCGVWQIEIGRICTACHAQEFFSHRAEGGETGRFAVLMGLEEAR
jgi:YfiH family protein